MIRRLVRRHAVLPAVNRELRIRDAIRVTPHDGAEIRGVIDVRLEAVESEHHIYGVAMVTRAPRATE